jgi:hypothetical protein
VKKEWQGERAKKDGSVADLDEVHNDGNSHFTLEIARLLIALHFRKGPPTNYYLNIL